MDFSSSGLSVSVNIAIGNLPEEGQRWKIYISKYFYRSVIYRSDHYVLGLTLIPLYKHLYAVRLELFIGIIYGCPKAQMG